MIFVVVPYAGKVLCIEVDETTPTFHKKGRVVETISPDEPVEVSTSRALVPVAPPLKGDGIQKYRPNEITKTMMSVAQKFYEHMLDMPQNSERRFHLTHAWKSFFNKNEKLLSDLILLGHHDHYMIAAVGMPKFWDVRKLSHPNRGYNLFLREKVR